MEAVKTRLRGLRAGFVLPFSLMMTFVVLLIVGAAANYCTQTMRASDVYLLRSRARMAAQSTIEKAKLVISDSCSDHVSEIVERGVDEFGQAVSDLVVSKVKNSTPMVQFLSDMKWDEAHRSVSDTTVTLGTRSDIVNGIHSIYATAEVRHAGVTATVTLEEDIQVPRQDANIFHYAYFSNGDGHLTCLGSGHDQRLTVNGDVRANGNFYLSGVNVNGFVFAQGKVELAGESDGGWNGRYMTTRTAESYNDNFRKVNTRHNIKTVYDIRVRPTNPITRGVPWEGGFRGAHNWTKDPPKSFFAWLVTELTNLLKVLLNYNVYDSDEIPVTKNHKDIQTELDPKEKIINEDVGNLPMPRIVSDSEPEMENDKHLRYYRENYAATARTPKGMVGGWLICSNAYLTASGKAEQLSAALKLSWTEHHEEEVRQETKDVTETIPEQTIPGEVIRAGGRVFEALTPNSLPVYEYLTADEYAAKVASNPDEAANWYQLRGDHTDTGNGTAGAFAEGYTVTIPSEQPHAGDHLFFEKTMFDNLLRTNFNMRAGNVRAALIDNPEWQPKYVKATYDSVNKKNGSELVKKDYVTGYGYRDDKPTISLTWGRTSSGYATTSVGTKIVPIGIIPLVVDGAYVRSSDIGSVADEFKSYSITASDPAFTSFGGEWFPANGYYSDEAQYVRGYFAYQLMRNWTEGQQSYSLKRDWVTNKGQEPSYVVTRPDTQTFSYTGVYYSADPVGLIEINTNEWDSADITITFRPIEKSTATKTTNTYRKILETKLVPLHAKKSSMIYSKFDSYGNSKYGSPFYDECFEKAAMEEKADYFGYKYDSALASQIKGYFSGANDGWSRNTSQRYSSGTDGYLAIRVIGIFSDESREMDFDVEYAYLSNSEAGQIDESELSERMLDVYSVPVYEYSSSMFSPEISGPNWYQIKSSDGFNGKVINRGEDVQDAAEHFDGKYGLTKDDVLNTVNNFFKTNRSWNPLSSRRKRASSPTGYLVIKVLWDRSGSSHRLECEYSTKMRAGYDLDVESVKESETTYFGNVPSDCIPIYDYIDDRTYQGKSSWAKQFWVAATGEDGCWSDKAHGFFLTRDLNRIAELKKDARLLLTADGVKKAIVDQEDATGYTWSTANNFACHLSVNPKGYISVKVDAYHNIKITPVFLSVASGEVHKPDTVIPEHTETRQETSDVTIPAYDEPKTADVVRPLRGIFVKQGYKIIADNTFTPPGWTKSLEIDHADLELWKGHELKTGSTTADLRPFREDGDFKCNEATDNGGKAADKGAVILIGTWDYPILIDGPVVFESDVLIRGFVTGNGTIYSGRNIHIIGDIHYKNPPYWPYNGGAEPDTKDKDLLRLVARGSIVIGNYAMDPSTGKRVDDAWDKLLEGDYITGRTNSRDGLANGVAYVKTDYTRPDRTDGGVYKIKYDHTLKKLDREQAKYYESVVGDYVFLSRNDQADANKPLTRSAAMSNPPYCDCRFSQHWDCNFGVDSYRNGESLQYASFQSTVIQDYVNKNNWTTSDRMGTGAVPGRSFWDYLWKQNWASFLTFARENYYQTGATTKPRLNEIQHIDAVLYACQGLYGAVGGQNTPCVINGALLTNEEALLPFARMKRTLFGSQADGFSLTINWDIRLNRQSGDAKKNGEDSADIFKNPLWGKNESSSEPGKPRILRWMQVPDSFNEEYHATP